MKKILFSILSTFLFIGGLTLSACGPQPQASISLESDSFSTEEGKENHLDIDITEEFSTYQVFATVENVSDARIEISNSFENFAKVITPISYNPNTKQSTINIRGVSEGDGYITIDSRTGSAPQQRINFSVYSRIVDLSQKSEAEDEPKSQYVVAGESTILSEKRFLEIESRSKDAEANRKNIIWKTENSEFSSYITSSESQYSLTLPEDFEGNSIVLIATDTETSKFTPVVLEVVKPFDSKSVVLQWGRETAANNLTDNSQFTLVRNDDSSIESALYVNITVPKNGYGYEFDWTCENQGQAADWKDFLSIGRVGSVIDSNPGANFGTYSYNYEIKAKRNKDIDPPTLRMGLNIIYSDYSNLSYSIIGENGKISGFDIITSDVVDSITVSNDNGVIKDKTKLSLYNSYAKDEKGMPLQVVLGPSTANELSKRFQVGITGQDPQNDLLFTTAEGQKLYVVARGEGQEGFVLSKAENSSANADITFDNNTKIFVKSSGNSLEVNYTLNFAVLNSSISNEIVLTTKNAPTEDFELLNASDVIFRTNSLSSKEASFNIEGFASAEGFSVSAVDLPVSFGALTYNNGKISFQIENTETNFPGEKEIYILHENGFRSTNTIKLNAFIELEDAVVGVDGTTLATVAELEMEDGDPKKSVNKLTMQNGNSIGLVFRSNVDLQVKDSGDERIYFKYKIGDDTEFTEYTGNNDFFSINSSGILTFKGTFKGELQVVFKGYDASMEEREIVKPIALESYIPATGLMADSKSAVVDLLAFDSVSSQDMKLTEGTVILWLRNSSDKAIVSYNRPEDFTISTADGSRTAVYQNGKWGAVEGTESLLDSSAEYYIADIQNEGNYISFHIFARTTKGLSSLSDSLIVKYNKFASLQEEVIIHIKNAERVQSLSIRNRVGSGIYIDSTSNNPADLRKVILTSVYPQTAYNTDVRFQFVANIGSDSNILTIDHKTGLVQAVKDAGGAGYIYVLPEDAIKQVGGVDTIVYISKNSDGSYSEAQLPLSNLNDKGYADLIQKAYFLAEGGKYISFANIIQRTKIIVANGASQVSALRIYDRHGLENIVLSKHYEIMNSLDLTEGWKSFGSLSGSIRGYAEDGKESLITLTFNGQNLFTEIAEGGSVYNLNFVGNITTGQGFVANTNKGTIENVKVDINSANMTSSTISGMGNVGAIVGTNNNSIKSSAVLGASVKGGTVGGVAGANSGTIENCRVEFYNFAAGSNKIKGTSYAGGIVGQSIGGTITGSYAYDYTLTKDSTVNISATTAGALVGTSSGDSQISNSFAVVGLNKYCGSGNVSVDDCYLSYYDGENYTTNAPTEKTGENWIMPVEEGFKAWVNGGKAHLKFNQAKQLENLDDIAVKAKDGVSLPVGEGKKKAILMLQTVKETDLSEEQRSLLQTMNTVAISALFEGISEEEEGSLLVSSSNTNFVLPTANALLIRGVGSVKLTLHSRQNLTETKEIEVEVIYSISDLVVKYDNREVSALQVQEGKSAAVEFSIKNSLYLGGEREYDMAQDVYSLTPLINGATSNTYLDFSIQGWSGLIQSHTGAAYNGPDYELTASLSLTNINLDTDYQDAISSAFTSHLRITAFEGSTFIGVIRKEISLSPAVVSKLSDVVLNTDSESDFLKIGLKLGDVDLTSEIPTNGVGEYIFSLGGVNRIAVNVAASEYDNHSRNYDLTISVVESYKHQIESDEEYTLVLTSKSGTASNEKEEIKLLVKSQKLNYINFANYKHGSIKTVNNKLIYTRLDDQVSMLSPGSTSYLVVNVDPTFAYFDHFTLTYAPQDGNNLVFTKLLNSDDGVRTYVEEQSGDELSYQLDSGLGVKITPSYESRAKGEYVFKIYVPGNISADYTFPITLAFYDSQNNKIETVGGSSYNLYVSALKQADISLGEDETNSVIAKGSTKTLVVELDSNQVLEGRPYLTGVASDINVVSFEGPKEMENGRNVYTLQVYAGINAATSNTNGLGLFNVNALVSRVMDGSYETKPTTFSLTLADFSIADMKIGGETGNSIKAYVGVERSIDLGYVFAPENYAYDPSNPNEVEKINKLTAARKFFEENSYYPEDLTDTTNVSNGFRINTVKNTDENRYEALPLSERLVIVIGNSETKINWKEGTGEYAGKKVYTSNASNYMLIYDNGKLSIKGLASTANDIQFRVRNYIYSDDTEINRNTLVYDFYVGIELYTDEEVPYTISNEAGFRGIENEAKAQNYILTNDIYLNDYEPMNTDKIKSLDGNGYTIYINSFKTEGSGELNLALFKEVDKDTTLKNIRVNVYRAGKVRVQTNNYDKVNIAGFAINNKGIITNCEVVAFDYTDPNGELPKISGKTGLVVDYYSFDSTVQITPASGVESKVAGFVITNEDSGSITNSRVGGTDIILLTEKSSVNAKDEQPYIVKELDLFSISAKGDMAGFVMTNVGAIASSFVANYELINNSESMQYKTAGFAIDNSGKILTSYSEGRPSDKKDDAFATGSSLCLSGSSISSKGVIAGFVYTNSSSVVNSYSNILIQGLGEGTTSSFGAGFVYINSKEILGCYSGCKLQTSNITQTNFSGIDEAGRPLNTGKIELSYYNGTLYTDDPSTTPEVMLNSGATLLKQPGDAKSFYGFVFASAINGKDGLWFMRDNGTITLTSPNQIAISNRYEIKDEATKTHILYYSTLVGKDTIYTTYGSQNNPIIIRTAQEFQDAMGASKFTSIKNQFTDTTIMGHYRLVADIKLSDINAEDGFAVVGSVDREFTGSFDGNGFAITDISLSSKNASVGLFGTIKGGSVLNLNLGVVAISASTAATVGTLSGLVDDTTIVNVKVSQSLPENEEQMEKYGVLGQRITGGIIGMVFGNSKLNNLSIENAIVQSSFYSDLKDNKGNKITPEEYYNNFNSSDIRDTYKDINGLVNNGTFNNISFAGGLVGYMDIGDRGSYTYVQNLAAATFNVVRLRATGTTNVRAEIVGGLVGYSGYDSGIKDAGLVLSRGTINSSLLSYNAYVGGLIGIARSNYMQMFAEHDESIQSLVEDNMRKYYRDSAESTERGVLDLFISKGDINGAGIVNYSPKYIGGLIGLANDSQIAISYSKLNVISTTAVVGGIVGRITGDSNTYAYRNSNETLGVATNVALNEVYATGDVRGNKVAGGIVGEISENTKLLLCAVNALNYFSVLDHYSSDFANGEDKNLYLSNIGVKAIVGKNGVVGQTVITVLPETVSIADETADNNTELTSHVKFYGVINATRIGTINVDTGITYGGLDVARMTATDRDHPAAAYGKVSPLSDMDSAKAGFEITNGAFISSNFWQVENWNHPTTQLYPSINLNNLESFIWLDATPKSVKTAISKMQNSSVEVRVRGLDENDQQTKNGIDLRGLYGHETINIVGFSGKISGGWKADGSRITEGTGEDLNGVPLIISSPIFENMQTGATFERLTIKYSSDAKDGSKDNVFENGTTFIKGSVQNTTFDRVRFDFSALNQVQIEADSTGNAGIIAPQANGSSFEGVSIITGAAGQGYPFFVMSYNNNNASVNIGLLAGEIKQTQAYKTMRVENISIISSCENIMQVNIPNNGSTNETTVNVGLYAGQITADTGRAGISLTAGGLKKDPKITNNLKISVSGVKVDNKNPQIKELNLGGFYGSVAGTTRLVANGGDALDVSVGVLTITEANKDENANIGGIVGNAQQISNVDISQNMTLNLDINDVSFVENAKLKSGLLAGSNGNSMNITGFIGRSIAGSLKANAVLNNPYIGGLIGQSSGLLTITNVDARFDLYSVAKNTDTLKINSSSLAAHSNAQCVSLNGMAHVGGYVGSATDATISGGQTSGNIAISGDGAMHVGGAFGTVSGTLTINTGAFSATTNFVVENKSTGSRTNSSAAETLLGGIAGYATQINAGQNNVETFSNMTGSTSNFFVNAKSVIGGGIVGKLGQNTETSTSTIQGTKFGGAFKPYGANSNGANHTYGGIVGDIASGQTASFNNNTAWGDVIVLYGGKFAALSSYNFGGIVGQVEERVTIEKFANNTSLMTSNNDRATDLDNIKAMVGGNGTTTGQNVGISSVGEGNRYSSSITLCTDENVGTDTSYIASSYNGYSGEQKEIKEPLITKIGRSAEVLTLGSKFNPVKITNSATQEFSASNNTNGISYFYFDGEKDKQAYTSPITLKNQNNEQNNIAIIGDGMTLSYKGGATSFIAGGLGTHSFISGLVLDVDMDGDATAANTNVGGLVNSMSGGTIYATAVRGEMSIGGEKKDNSVPFVSLGAMVGDMTGGRIDECMTAVDMVYRAGVGGTAADVVVVSGTGTKYIQRTYSTGRVESYINANLYAFTNGKGSEEKATAVNIKDSYTISKVLWQDHTKVAEEAHTLGVFGDAACTNCWFDKDATETNSYNKLTYKKNSTTQKIEIDTAKSSKIDTTNGSNLNVATADSAAKNFAGTNSITNNGFKNEKSGWVNDKEFNFGYATRRFGFLKQSSIIEEDSTGTQYFKIPNAGKLKQIESGLALNYKLTQDIDFAKTVSYKEAATNDAAGSFITGQFSGIFDGQGFTIDNFKATAGAKDVGLFYQINGGQIKNLRLTNVDIQQTGTGASNSFGALVGSIYGGKTRTEDSKKLPTISNILTSGFVYDGSGKSAKNLGGIIGSVYGAQNVIIENCTNYVDVWGESSVHVGGIVGQIYKNSENTVSSDVEIKNCLNYGPINTNNGQYAGGMVGLIEEGSRNITIANCGNENSVLAGFNNGATGKNYYAGGIVGQMASGTISQCYNTAMVKAGNKNNGSISYAGGIAGQAAASPSNCTNSGMIEAQGLNVKKENIKLSGGSTSNNGTIWVEQAINVAAHPIANGKAGTNCSNTGTSFANGVYKKGDGDNAISGLNFAADSGTSFSAVVINDYDDLGFPLSWYIEQKLYVESEKLFGEYDYYGIYYYYTSGSSRVFMEEYGKGSQEDMQKLAQELNKGISGSAHFNAEKAGGTYKGSKSFIQYSQVRFNGNHTQNSAYYEGAFVNDGNPSGTGRNGQTQPGASFEEEQSHQVKTIGGASYVFAYDAAGYKTGMLGQGGEDSFTINLADILKIDSDLAGFYNYEVSGLTATSTQVSGLKINSHQETRNGKLLTVNYVYSYDRGSISDDGTITFSSLTYNITATPRTQSTTVDVAASDVIDDGTNIVIRLKDTQAPTINLPDDKVREKYEISVDGNANKYYATYIKKGEEGGYADFAVFKIVKNQQTSKPTLETFKDKTITFNKNQNNYEIGSGNLEANESGVAMTAIPSDKWKPFTASITITLSEEVLVASKTTTPDVNNLVDIEGTKYKYTTTESEGKTSLTSMTELTKLESGKYYTINYVRYFYEVSDDTPVGVFWSFMNIEDIEWFGDSRYRVSYNPANSKLQLIPLDEYVDEPIADPIEFSEGTISLHGESRRWAYVEERGMAMWMHGNLPGNGNIPELEEIDGEKYLPRNNYIATDNSVQINSQLIIGYSNEHPNAEQMPGDPVPGDYFTCMISGGHGTITLNGTEYKYRKENETPQLSVDGTTWENASEEYDNYTFEGYALDFDNGSVYTGTMNTYNEICEWIDNGKSMAKFTISKDNEYIGILIELDDSIKGNCSLSYDYYYLKVYDEGSIGKLANNTKNYDINPWNGVNTDSVKVDGTDYTTSDGTINLPASLEDKTYAITWQFVDKTADTDKTHASDNELTVQAQAVDRVGIVLMRDFATDYTDKYLNTNLSGNGRFVNTKYGKNESLFGSTNRFIKDLNVAGTTTGASVVIESSYGAMHNIAAYGAIKDESMKTVGGGLFVESTTTFAPDAAGVARYTTKLTGDVKNFVSMCASKFDNFGDYRVYGWNVNEEKKKLETSFSGIAKSWVDTATDKTSKVKLFNYGTIIGKQGASGKNAYQVDSNNQLVNCQEAKNGQSIFTLIGDSVNNTTVDYTSTNAVVGAVVRAGNGGRGRSGQNGVNGTKQASKSFKTIATYQTATPNQFHNVYINTEDEKIFDEGKVGGVGALPGAINGLVKLKTGSEQPLSTYIRDDVISSYYEAKEDEVIDLGDCGLNGIRGMKNLYEEITLTVGEKGNRFMIKYNSGDKNNGKIYLNPYKVNEEDSTILFRGDQRGGGYNYWGRKLGYMIFILRHDRNLNQGKNTLYLLREESTNKRYATFTEGYSGNTQYDTSTSDDNWEIEGGWTISYSLRVDPELDEISAKLTNKQNAGSYDGEKYYYL